MKTRNKVLITALAASAIGLAAVPSFADSDDGVRERPQQTAFRGHGDRDDDRRGHHMRGHGPHGKAEMRGRHKGPRHSGGPGRGDFAGGPRDGGMTVFLIERFDTDEDGNITAAEIAAVNAERVGNYDADGDGALSLAEFKALWSDTQDERIVRDFQHLDPNGDATVTLEEYSERFDRLMSRLDRDDDGVIGADELRGPRGGPDGKGMGPGKGPRKMGEGPGPGPQAPAPDVAPEEQDG
ncbi:MAG: hypothetical protein GY798_34755 [Hyphomicrobiales bacterium]|nr:hypothetical protein [Hyphomicrobiales bacterium]